MFAGFKMALTLTEKCYEGVDAESDSIFCRQMIRNQDYARRLGQKLLGISSTETNSSFQRQGISESNHSRISRVTLQNRFQRLQQRCPNPQPFRLGKHVTDVE
jgi:hypothetical protein